MSDLREALRTLVANGLPDGAIVPIVNDLVEGAALDDCDDQKWCAMVAELGADMLDADETAYDDCVFENGHAQYLVLTDDEKESRWDDCLESYLDDGCVEGADSHYFDREAWKKDARMDGAGHCLGSYDGNEYEFSGFGEYFYMYRIN
jgi:hypothetical protein